MSDRGINMTQLHFITCNSSSLSNYFEIQPIVYPIVSNQKILTAEPVSSSFAPSSMSLADNLYKVEYNDTLTANNWYIQITGSNINLISGSYITGSLCNVYFNLANHVSNPLAVSAIEIQPINKNVMFNGNFVSKEHVTYTTDANGTFTASLIPQPYAVFIKSPVKNTTFNILPSGSSCNAKDVIVSSTNVSSIITPRNNALFAYPASVSDARYMLSGSSVSFNTSSFVTTASFNAYTASMQYSYLPDITDIGGVVGINQSNPGLTLDVNGSIGNSIGGLSMGSNIFGPSGPQTMFINSFGDIEIQSFMAGNVLFYPYGVAGNGAVGIGLSSPSYPLDVFLSGIFPAQFKTDNHCGLKINANGNSFMQFLYNDTPMSEWGYSEIRNTLYFGPAGQDNGYLNIDMGNGYIGVGTNNTSPSYPLDINGAIHTDTSLGIDIANNTNGAKFEVSDTTAGGALLGFFSLPNLSADGSRVFYGLGRGWSYGNSGYCGWADNGYNQYVMIGHYGADDILTISNTRKVGVNTTYPSYDLDVNGVIGNGNYGHGNNLQLDNGGGDLGLFGFSSILLNTALGNITLDANGYSVNLNPNGGNVGIGQPVPSYALDVSGDIHANGNLITQNDTITSTLMLATILGTPSVPTQGQIYFNGVDNHFYGFDGTSWKQLDN